MFSDEEIKKIKKDYKKLKSYKKCAEKNNISVYMARKIAKGGKSSAKGIVKEKKDKGARLCKDEKGKHHMPADGAMEDYMEKKRKDALDFIGKCLDTMSSEEKLTNAPINQIASAMGVVMDKFAKKDDDDGRLGEILKAVGKIE